jgi:hypothetical protein
MMALVIEIIFSYLGVDGIANYGEFVLQSGEMRKRQVAIEIEFSFNRG